MSTDPNDPTTPPEATDPAVEPFDYARLRAALRDVDVPPAARRQGIEAAMAEYDALASANDLVDRGDLVSHEPAGAAGRGAVVVPLRRRPWLAGLGSVAAALAAVVVGWSVLRSNDGPNTALTAQVVTSSRQAVTVTTPTLADATGSSAPAVMSADQPPTAANSATSDSIPALRTPDEVRAYVAQATSLETAAAGAATSAGAPKAQPSGTSDQRAPASVVPSPATTLLAAGTAAMTTCAPTVNTVGSPSADSAGTTSDTGNLTADTLGTTSATVADTVIGPVTYLGTPALVVQRPNGRITVIDLATCLVLIDLAQ